MLADTEKAYHVYGKLTRNQENSKMYWLPKTMVIDDPYFEPIDVEVDFDKYVEMDEKKNQTKIFDQINKKYFTAGEGLWPDFIKFKIIQKINVESNLNVETKFFSNTFKIIPSELFVSRRTPMSDTPLSCIDDVPDGERKNFKTTTPTPPNEKWK